MTYTMNDIFDVLSESTIDNIFDIELFNEKADDETKGNKFKKVSDKLGAAYIGGINKSSDFLAKAIVKKPKEGSSTEVQEKYEQKLLKVKSVIKIGEILLSKAVLVGPLDVIATAALITGIVKSDDPTDKLVVSKLKALAGKAEALKNKITSLFNKNKDKPVTEEDKRQYDTTLLQGKNIAKEIDAVKEKINRSNVVTESVLVNKFDEYLLKEDGSLVDNAYDILSIIVEKTDYTQYDIFPVVEHYIDMMI